MTPTKPAPLAGAERGARIDWRGHCDAENAAMVELLRGLPADAWSHPSLCAGWTVHDVAAHINLGYAFGVPTTIWKLVRYGFALNRVSLHEARRWTTTHSPEETLSTLIPGLEGRRMPGVNKLLPARDMLADHFLHMQDICRPLGIKRDVPQGRLAAALVAVSKARYPVSSSRRARGLRLVADDTGTVVGSGPEVHGSAEALAVSVGGRGVALAELSGPGLEVLRSRMPSATLVAPMS